MYRKHSSGIQYIYRRSDHKITARTCHSGLLPHAAWARCHDSSSAREAVSCMAFYCVQCMRTLGKGPSSAASIPRRSPGRYPGGMVGSRENCTGDPGVKCARRRRGTTRGFLAVGQHISQSYHKDESTCRAHLEPQDRPPFIVLLGTFWVFSRPMAHPISPLSRYS